MMNQSFMLLITLLIASFCVEILSFKSLNVRRTPSVSHFRENALPSDIAEDEKDRWVVPATIAAGIQTFPFSVFAADGSTSNAFVFPLVISVLTMVPFIWYQQQLAPKPRTVKQIELDDNLKPKKRTEVSKGSEGIARAGKK